jgi:hypothetical protein
VASGYLTRPGDGAGAREAMVKKAIFSEGFVWKSIGTAPVEQDVQLIVTDGGKPYLLTNPFKLTAAGWVSSSKGTPLAVTPLQWKPYFPSRKRR